MLVNTYMFFIIVRSKAEKRYFYTGMVKAFLSCGCRNEFWYAIPGQKYKWHQGRFQNMISTRNIKRKKVIGESNLSLVRLFRISKIFDVFNLIPYSPVVLHNSNLFQTSDKLFQWFS